MASQRFQAFLAAIRNVIALKPAVTDGSVLRRVYAEQMDVALRLVPFSAVVAMAVTLVVTFVFWTSGPRYYLGSLGVAVILLTAFSLNSCWKWRTSPQPKEIGVGRIRLLVVVASLYGLCLTSIPCVLFYNADAYHRLLIASTVSGLIATGISVAVIPLAALAYSGSLIVGSFLSLASTGERFFVLVAILLAFYSMFICLTIIYMSKLIIERVLNQIEVEQQKEVISLLLNDFEENASDWVWEIDSRLRIQNASARFSQVASRTSMELQGMFLATLLDLDMNYAKDEETQRYLWQPIAGRAAFRNCLIPVKIGGETRWWSLTGKPVYNDNGRFVGYRGVGADVTTATQSKERLSYLASYDPLTDLPNRTQFLDQLARASASLPGTQSSFAVLYIDLDEFKIVNDTFGHAIGDKLLMEVAKRLRKCVRKNDVVSRLSGDEFAILAPGMNVDSSAALARRILKTITRPFQINGIQMNIQMSIGIALAPTDSVQDIVRCADLALYRAKTEGRNGYRFYEAEMGARIEAKRALASDLRNALARNEFQLHFQPIVCGKSLKTVSFETLLRWNHPEHGPVSPAVFIPIAEETGYIVAIDNWLIHETCRIAATWPDNIRVAINISPIHIRHSDLIALVTGALQASGLAANRLELEITESVFLEANSGTVTMLRQLREMGIVIALDDFGTGHSSLSYLRKMPFDKIKIDRSFIRDLPNEAGSLAIVRAVLGLGANMGMLITAEGVETFEQLTWLQREGCDQLQGFLFSAGGRADQVPEMLRFDKTRIRAVS
ncbi:MAG: putative bifunctional diguanylate cyclase/phosphodiesterase [Phyllobacterium sp.]